MKLDVTIVREVLLQCESHASLTPELSWNPLRLEFLEDHMSNCTKENIVYTLILLEEAGYIDAHIMEADSGIYNILIYRLTYSGHEFLDTIRSPLVFKKIESAIASVGSASLPVVLELGKQILLTMLVQ